jgi:hypothetical protein
LRVRIYIKIRRLGVFSVYESVEFLLYIEAEVMVISTCKAATLAHYWAQDSGDSFAIEGIRKVEEESPPPPVAFSSPENPWGHRVTPVLLLLICIHIIGGVTG